jgi:hypothetical protein
MDQELNLNELLQQRLSRRDLFRNAGVAGISLSALLDLAWQPAASLAQAPTVPASTPKIGGQLIGKLEGPTTVTDPAKFPKSFKEAPQLAELVKAGKLPSVKERIGEDPLVIKPVHEIGRYGGTIRRGFTGPGDWSAGVRFDRDQLNETFWLGLGTPGSVVCTEASPYNPGREYRKLWSTYDPKNANAMLDTIGLNRKDGEGYRLRTDGKGRLRIEITTYLGFMPFSQIAEMIRLQWGKLGIHADVAELERSLLNSRRAANETQISMEIMWGTENMYAHSPVNLFPYDPTSAVGPLYGKWFATGGESGKTPPGRLKELLELYRAGFSAPEKQHYELGKKIWRIAIEEQYVIGTVGLAPGLMGLRVVKNSMGNVPGRMFNGSSTLHPKQSKPETAFYKR